MNKKGLIGKIILIFLALLVVIGAIIGITIFQAYSLYQTVKQETIVRQDMTGIIEKGDCLKISELEASISRIKGEAESACKNPIIRIAIDKMSQMEIKCSNIPNLEKDAQQKLAPVKEMCNQKTAVVYLV